MAHLFARWYCNVTSIFINPFRELPDIPGGGGQAHSRVSTIGSTHQSHKPIPRIKQQPSGRHGNYDSVIEVTVPVADDIYDNDMPLTPSHQQHDPNYNPYTEATPKKPTAVQLKKAKQPQAMVIQNETYESVVETQRDTLEEFYDSDPFEKELSIRRNSNPNLYSEVRKLDDHPATENTTQASSVVLTNPTFAPRDEDETDEYLEVTEYAGESSPAIKPLSTEPALTPPHVDSDPNDDEGGETYVDVMSPSPHHSQSTSGEVLSSPTTGGTEKGDVALVEGRPSNDRGSYFLFTEHYDNIMSSQQEDDLERCDSYQDMSGSSAADWGVPKQQHMTK